MAQPIRQLFTIVDEGGQNLVTRVYGDLQAPSFPTLGLLFSIATFAEGSGLQMQALSTPDVQIVYKKFGSLLFILATSNLLLQREALQELLQAVYEGLLVLLGADLLRAEDVLQLDKLRKSLRGLQALDYLLSTEASLPSLMLPGPQVLGVASETETELHGALRHIAHAANTKQAAILSDGAYMAATPGWWKLSPSEARLLQCIATWQQPEETQVQIPVYLSVSTHQQPQYLVMLMVCEGVQLLLICRDKPDLDLLRPSLAQYLQHVESLCRAPPHKAQPADGLAGISFSLALAFSPSPPLITLFWGTDRGRPLPSNASGSPSKALRSVFSEDDSSHQQAMATQRALTSFVLQSPVQEFHRSMRSGDAGGTETKTQGGAGHEEDEGQSGSSMRLEESLVCAGKRLAALSSKQGRIITMSMDGLYGTSEAAAWASRLHDVLSVSAK